MIKRSTFAFVFLSTINFTEAVTLVANEIPIGESFTMTELKESNFYGLVVDKDDSKIIGEKAWFINFFQSSCQHCREFSSTWEEFHQSHKNEINFATVDCTGDGFSLCVLFRIK